LRRDQTPQKLQSNGAAIAHLAKTSCNNGHHALYLGKACSSDA
jgi:hypothetical protein